MKHLICLFLCVMAVFFVSADNGPENIVMGQSVSGPNNRSELILPIVTYSSADNSLTIEFESEDSYQLTIEDVYGITWYTSPVNTNGIPTIYYVNLPSDNTYTITISSTDVTFIGYLQL